VKRSKLCLSCHVGNTKEGKFVTHAMYAAGHPPLPSFEIATFSEEMPRHWQYPSEKKPEVQKIQDLDPEEAKFERTQLVVLGGTVALRESLNLVATQAEEALAKKPEERMLDLALFDCYACHHELKSPGWRTQRGYQGKPGRPQAQVWPTSLVRASILSLGLDNKELDQSIVPLVRVFDDRPFGDLEKASKKGHEAVKRIDIILNQLKERKMNYDKALQLLKTLSTFKEADYPDYDSARQLAWAFQVIFAEVNNQKYNDVKASNKTLNDLVKLSLPATRSQKLETDLPGAMKKRAEYDPDAFKQVFTDWAGKKLMK